MINSEIMSWINLKDVYSIVYSKMKKRLHAIYVTASLSGDPRGMNSNQIMADLQKINRLIGIL